MSNAIVVNTLTGAVSEYSNFAFQSITPTHAGSSGGLFTLGGNLDDAAPIVATVTTGKTQWGTAMLKFISLVYLAVRGSGTSSVTVTGDTASYKYTMPVNPAGESRVVPGKGIKESFISISYSNDDGSDFLLDRIEFETPRSTTRRI